MGCGNTKGQASQPSSSSNPDKSKKGPKLMDVKTNADDLENITQTADMQILDLSQLSMTDLVSNGMMLVNAVIGLIQANIARNQLMKAVLRRMQALEPSFQELQAKNSKLTKELVVNLVSIVDKIKKFCEKLMETDKCLWDKFKDMMTAKGQLEELSHLNELLTKAQADLQVPLQLEASQKIDKMFDYLKELNKKGGDVFSKHEKNSSVLPIAQKCLKNEEAFVFWFECMPDKYQIILKEFEPLFNDYIEIYKEVKLKPETLRKIINFIRGTADPYNEAELINAKKVNSFFESLPIEAQWNNEVSLIKAIDESIQRRDVEVKKVFASEEKKLEEKIKKIEGAATAEEKKLIADPDFIRFLTKKAFMVSEKEKTEIDIRNVFIRSTDGEVMIFGSAKKEGEFIINGTIDKKGNLTMEMKLAKGDVISAEGRMDYRDADHPDLYMLLDTELGKMKIYLDLEFWFGYSMKGDEMIDLRIWLKIIGNDFVGYSGAEVGDAVWTGTITGTEFKGVERYINEYYLDHIGVIANVGAGKEVKGRWVVNEEQGVWDEFYLSYIWKKNNDKIEADDGKEDDMEPHEKCPKGHVLEWSWERVGNERFWCDRCKENRSQENGRWTCQKDGVDICGACLKIPKIANKKCAFGHLLEWGVREGRTQYECDVCRKQGGEEKRWRCNNCNFEMCNECRPRFEKSKK